MPNNFLTIKEVARQALPRLMENLVFPNLVYKDFSNDFQKKGNKIQIRKPVVLTAKDFDQSKGVEPQDLDDSQTMEVTLDKIATVDVDIQAIEGATNVDDLNRQFIEPAAVALAQKINSDGLDCYKDIPYISGTVGTTPSTLDDLAAVRKVLNANKVPTSGRVAVWDTEADAKFTTIPAIVNAEKSGTTSALREGSIGRIFGLDNYMSQAVKHHAAGTLSAAVKPKTSVFKGATSLTLSATAVTGKLVKGDILTILGDSYVVTADAVADSNEVTVPIYPALKRDVTTATVVTLTSDHTANLAFNPMAFAFVVRPLVQPSGVESYVTSYNGISLRVTKGYDMKYKKELLSMDVLYSYATVYPEMAVRVLG
ncbi:P22 phage major capsid protein family protein [Caproicibacterium amylolyticum]|uniref:P22 coat protein n=1 Tax=Caproicibacterium amylolyticum TaxID=2766537 RepID=A0A7G9WF89_9FIRM|nr:P22 phage major capsid protein family protein [Caproicibacterium amylolyticum]QNO17351.1 P22 coat protein [Caproicibacterium amylolyticum]